MDRKNFKAMNSKPQSIIINYSGTFDESYLTEYLKAVVCNNNACNTCIDCLKINDNEYSDIIMIESNTSKQDLNDIVYRLSMGGLEDNGTKIAVFKDAHNLSIINLNAILKFVEEPPTKTHFVFLTSNADKIIDTIKSRSIMISPSFAKESLNEIELLNLSIEDILNLHNVLKEYTTKQIKEMIVQYCKNDNVPNKDELMTLTLKSSTSINKNLFIDRLVILLGGK